MSKKNTKKSNVQSRLVDVNQLEDPKSRVEAYLHFINGTGKIVDINALPKPQSRVEWLLLYLCENLANIGGGGQGPTNAFVDAQLNGDILVLHRENGTTKEVPFDDFVTKWEDLSDVHRLTDINLFNPLTVIYDERYNSVNGSIEKADGWARVSVDVTDGTHTVIKNKHDSQTYVFLDAQDNALQVSPNTGSDENGRKKYLITVPQQVNNTPVAKLGFNIEPANVDTIEDIMVFKGAVTVPNQTIPFTNGADVIVDGSKVSVAFDNRNTNLVSQTVAGAINEINNKYSGSIKTWKDLEHVKEYDIANLLDLSKRIEGGHYNSTGAITNDTNWSTVLMPIKASTEYTMLRKDNRGEASRSVVFFNQDGTMVHYYNSAAAPSNGTYHYYTFTTTPDTAYLGISVPHTVSGSGLSCMIVEGHNYTNYTGVQVPYADGALIQVGFEVSHKFNNSNSSLLSTTVESAIKELDEKIGTTTTGVSSVVYDDDKTLTVVTNGQQMQYNLSPLIGIKTINGQAGTDGAISLTTTNNTTDSMEFNVGNQTYATLNFMTDQEATNIIDSWS